METDARVNDTDGDGLVDGVNPATGYGEYTFETDPLDSDTDDDNLVDGLEGLGWTINVTRNGLREEILVTANLIL